jgi:signal transduction histidine kinase
VRLSLRVQIGIGVVLVTGATVLLVLASTRSRLVEEFSRFEGGRDTTFAAAAARRLEAWYPSERGLAWPGADSVLATLQRPPGLELVLQNAAGQVVAATRPDLRRAQLSGGPGPGDALVLTVREGATDRTLRLLFDHPPTRAIHGADGRQVGTVYSLYLPRFGAMPHEQERIRSAVDRGLLLPLLIGALASIVLLLVTTISALSPVRTLTGATRRLAAGDFASRVPVKGAAELAELSTAFNGMADALERAEALRRQMVSDVAHELRTPLTNLRCRIEAIQDGLAPPDAAGLRALHDETLLLARLVEDLQLLSLAEAGRLPLERAEQDLREIATQAVAAVGPRAGAAGVALALAAGGPVRANVDAARIGQVLRNLLANAIAHTPAGGDVRVSVGTSGADAWLEVRDSGVGLTPEQQAHAFDRFWRADPARARDEGAGAGLGLAIVRQLVTLHGGDVGVSSTPGAGACFRVRLPATAAFTPPSSRRPRLPARQLPP